MALFSVDGVLAALPRKAATFLQANRTIVWPPHQTARYTSPKVRHGVGEASDHRKSSRNQTVSVDARTKTMEAYNDTIHRSQPVVQVDGLRWVALGVDVERFPVQRTSVGGTQSFQHVVRHPCAARAAPAVNRLSAGGRSGRLHEDAAGKHGAPVHDQVHARGCDARSQ